MKVSEVSKVSKAGFDTTTVKSVSPYRGSTDSDTTEHTGRLSELSERIVSATELSALLAQAHRDGFKADVELVRRCPCLWRVTFRQQILGDSYPNELALPGRGRAFLP